MWRYLLDGLFLLALWIAVATASAKLDSAPPTHAAKDCAFAVASRCD